jgi:hypothetical protein
MNLDGDLGAHPTKNTTPNKPVVFMEGCIAVDWMSYP